MFIKSKDGGMKKFILVLLVLVSGTMLAQVPDSLTTKLHRVGNTNGWTGSDSLQSYGSLHYSDSLRYVDFKYQYGQIYITVTDTGTIFTDSLQLFKGRQRQDDRGFVVDTLWDSSPLYVSNGTSTTVNILVGANLTKTYTLLDTVIGLLKIIRANVTVTANSVTKILFEAVKK